MTTPASSRRRSRRLAVGAAFAVVAAAGLSLPAVAEPAAPASPAAPQAAKPYQIGDEQAADVQLRYGGTTSQTIHHPGARYVKVHFDSLTLAPGDKVTVSDPAGRETHTYSGDPTRGIRAAGDSSHTVSGPGFWAMSVDGDTAVITLHAKGTAPASDLAVRADKYTRGFSADEQRQRDVGIQSVCETDARRDAVCYEKSHPTEYGKTKSVARMLNNGRGHCTAWRVGTSNTVFTNNHCAASQSELDAMELQFDYACATCGGNDPKPATKVAAAKLLKTDASLDYTLFTVDNFAAIEKFGYLQLDVRAPQKGERIYISGHGDTDPNELSIFENDQGGEECDVDSPQSDSTNMGYYCDTSGGSSGSPVFAASSNKVIGLHHLGGCLNEGTRIELIYPQVKDLIENG
ncbi:V8-like Glu-specific endopeptidase [Herbihabitans rhizosphaerae]|uniref:V8-like Glu-specific endopeptidase n=1 Tax=Herbihabitans rhizosphaerae TaxID=1872711 RepID=A0A4Q7KF41_9PSEU|nr:serine protease [Herbihabitans rhizosphaerae]RZS32721.1 V8-like Glu-specific endopeptidase [Herbihabitans rhizosphaerae]